MSMAGKTAIVTGAGTGIGARDRAAAGRARRARRRRRPAARARCARRWPRSPRPAARRSRSRPTSRTPPPSSRWPPARRRPSAAPTCWSTTRRSIRSARGTRWTPRSGTRCSPPTSAATSCMARAVRPQMIARGGGAVVNVASVTFFTGNALLLAYVASKGAVDRLHARARARGRARGHPRQRRGARRLPDRGDRDPRRPGRAVARRARESVDQAPRRGRGRRPRDRLLRERRLELRQRARRCWWTAAGCSAELQSRVVGARHVVGPAPGGKAVGLGEGAQPVRRVVLADDEDAVGLLDDREPSGDRQRAHARRPPTVTTTSSPRTATA